MHCRKYSTHISSLMSFVAQCLVTCHLVMGHCYMHDATLAVCFLYENWMMIISGELKVLFKMLISWHCSEDIGVVWALYMTLHTGSFCVPHKAYSIICIVCHISCVPYHFVGLHAKNIPFHLYYRVLVVGRNHSLLPPDNTRKPCLFITAQFCSHQLAARCSYKISVQSILMLQLAK